MNECNSEPPEVVLQITQETVEVVRLDPQESVQWIDDQMVCRKFFKKFTDREACLARRQALLCDASRLECCQMFLQCVFSFC